MATELRVNHGPVDPDLTLTKAEKEWLRSWNRHSEIPGEDAPEPTGDPNPDPNAGGEAKKYDDLTNDELKDLLSERDLPVSGNKADLVARLEEDDASKA